MCSYLHRAPNGVYYFRMGIPAELRPAMGGKREIKISLRLKDREAAKALIPDHTKAAHKLMEQARQSLAVAAPARTVQPYDPFAGMTQEDFERWEEHQADEYRKSSAEDHLREDAETWAAGLPADHHAVVLLKEERNRGDRYKEQSRRRKREDTSPRVAEVPLDRSNAEPRTAPEGKGIYLDTDIVDGWAAERKPLPLGKNAYLRDARLFNRMIGRKSVELITKADVMAYKRLLIADSDRSQVNIRDRLAYLRTLLEWAAQEDIVPSNVARDVKMTVTERLPKREDFNIDDLNALFAGPVHAKGDRPKGSFGEAAYWLPLIALYMGARREEIGQLRIADVKLVPYIDDADQRQEVWCLDITDTSERDALPNQVKNESSNRLVPLHPKLIELGFVEYVVTLPNRSGRVFPELEPTGTGQKLTDKWGQWFGRYKTACGIAAKTKVFHSLRHTWKTHAVDAGIVERFCRHFQGHESTDSPDQYGTVPAMRVLVKAIASYRVPGLEITPL